MSIFSKVRVKDYLKNFPLIVKIKRALFKVFSIDQRHSIFKNKKYFLNKFKIDNSKNIQSLDLNQGLVFSEYLGMPFFLKLRVGNYIESTVYETGMWESHIAKIISANIQSSNGSVIDVGANIGALAVPLAKKYPNNKFHLFEPHPVVFADLKDNISINKLENVIPNNCAVSNSEPGDINFYAQKKSGNMGLSSTKLNQNIEDHELIKVKTIKIDDYFASSDEKIAVIKIDVQGGEIEVLESAKKIIMKHRPIIIFEFEEEYFNHESEKNEARNKIIKYFGELDYKLHCITQDLNFYPELTLKHYYHGDILAMPFSIE